MAAWRRDQRCGSCPRGLQVRWVAQLTLPVSVAGCASSAPRSAVQCCQSARRAGAAPASSNTGNNLPPPGAARVAAAAGAVVAAPVDCLALRSAVCWSGADWNVQSCPRRCCMQLQSLSRLAAAVRAERAGGSTSAAFLHHLPRGSERKLYTGRRLSPQGYLVSVRECSMIVATQGTRNARGGHQAPPPQAGLRMTVAGAKATCLPSGHSASLSACMSSVAYMPTCRLVCAALKAL